MCTQAPVQDVKIVQQFGRRVIHQLGMGGVIIRIVKPVLQSSVDVRQLHPVDFIVVANLRGPFEQLAIPLYPLEQLIAPANYFCRFAVFHKKFIDGLKVQFENCLRLALKRFPRFLCCDERIAVAISADPRTEPDERWNRRFPSRINARRGLFKIVVKFWYCLVEDAPEIVNAVIHLVEHGNIVRARLFGLPQAGDVALNLEFE